MKIKDLPLPAAKPKNKTSGSKSSKCSVCNSSLKPWMTVPGDWRRQDVVQSWSIDRCPVCDFGSISPVPSVDEITEFYNLDEYYTHADEDVAPKATIMDRIKNNISWRFDKGAEPDENWLEALLARESIKKACDIGCGGGDFLGLLQDRDIESIGVEPDAAARAFAGSKGVKALPGTAEDLPNNLGSDFDAVFMSHVLEHTRDPMASLTNLYEILAPNGLLCVEVPNNACLGLDHAGNSWFWLDAPRHLNFFSEPNLKQAFQATGFEVEKIEYRGYCRQFNPQWENTERKIRNFMNDRGGEQKPHPNFWSLLFKTMNADDAQKYDSIRIFGRKS